MALDMKVGESLLDGGNLVEFWQEFANSCTRPRGMQELLVRAAQMTVQVLDGADEEFDEIIEGAPVDFEEAGLLPSDEERWEARVQTFRERFNC